MSETLYKRDFRTSVSLEYSKPRPPTLRAV